jgi:hypothetical protein
MEPSGSFVIYIGVRSILLDIRQGVNDAFFFFKNVFTKFRMNVWYDINVASI